MYYLESLDTIARFIIPIIVIWIVFRIIAGALRGAQRRSGTVNDTYQGIFYIIQQQHVGVIERLGKFHTIVQPGFHVRIPIVDRVRDARGDVDVRALVDAAAEHDARAARDEHVVVRAVVGVLRLGAAGLHADQADDDVAVLPQHLVRGAVDAAQLLPRHGGERLRGAHDDPTEVVPLRIDR